MYAFRFDLDGDAREDVSFKFCFSVPRHANGDEHTHVQKFQVLRATEEEAIHGEAGGIIIECETGKISAQSGVRVYVGIAPELFCGDASAIHSFSYSLLSRPSFQR